MERVQRFSPDRNLTWNNNVTVPRAPKGFTNVNDITSEHDLEEISRTYKRVAGFDPEILKSRPSLSVR